MTGIRVRTPFVLALYLASATAIGQVYKWTDEQERVHYGESPPPGSTPKVIAMPPSPSSLAQPRSGRTFSIPASSLPQMPPEQAERRRRIVEQMDREQEEKERAALRDSPDGKRACAMLQGRIRDAEAGVIRGQHEDRRLSADQQNQVLRVLRQEYEKACR